MKQLIAHPLVRLGLWVAAVWLLVAFLRRTADILTPFLVAFIAAYCLDPLVDWLESWHLPGSRRHLPRVVGASIVFVAALLLLLTVVLLVVPTMVEQVRHLGEKLTDFRDQRLPLLLEQIEGALGIALPRDTRQLLERVTGHAEMLRDVSAELLAPAGRFVSETMGGLFGVFLGLLNLVLAPILAFYLVLDIDHLRRATGELVPPRWRPAVFRRVREVDRVLSSFVRGQLTVCLVLGILYSLGLALLGLPLWAVVGMLSGFGNLIPYVGTLVGLTISLVLMLLEQADLLHLGGVFVVFGVVQALEGTVISPKIVGKTLGLHPVVVMLAILLGGEFFGFLGVLLAIPVTAVGAVFWPDLVRWYRSTAFYRGGEPGPGAMTQQEVAP